MINIKFRKQKKNHNTLKHNTMKKSIILATIAVAIIAGVSIFAACTKEENKESKHSQEVTSFLHDKNLSEDELNELMQNYDAKVTVLDSCWYVTTYFFSNSDYCVKSYLNPDNTVIAGLCEMEYSTEVLFTPINYNKVQLSFDDLIDSVFLTNIVFNEDEYKISFDIKVGEAEYTGTTIEVSETLLSEFMSLTNGTITTMSSSARKTLSKATIAILVERAIDSLESTAKECLKSMERAIIACLNAGGWPRVSHGVMHQYCTFECRPPQNQN